MITRWPRALALLYWCVAALSIACAHQSDASDDAALGTVNLPLVTTSGSVQYRLSDAVISLEGPISTALASTGDPSETVLAATLVAGDYTATLEPGWVLERDAGSGFQAVQAQLLSSNPRQITIQSGSVTPLTYRFETDGTIIAVGDGELRINLQVVERGGSGAACEDDALASVGTGLQNGSFEQPALPTPSWLVILPGLEPAGFGWTVTLDVDISRVGWRSGAGLVTGPPHMGIQHLDIVGFGAEGSLRQTIQVAPGVTYRVSLAYANNPVTQPVLPSASATVSAYDCDSALFSETLTHSTSIISSFDWTTFSRTFVATDPFVTLELVSTVGGGNGGMFFDSVAIESVP